MKIAQIIPMLRLAGAEIMCENLSYELTRQGHSVIVISMYDLHSAITDRLEKSGIRVIYLKKKQGIDFSMISKMKKIFNDEKIDVVHTHLHTTKYAIPASILSKSKTRIHTVHNVAEKESFGYSRILNRFFFKHCNTVPVSLSKLIQDTIVKEYKIPPEKTPIIFNGIDLSKCMPKSNYSISDNFKILHIGRFFEQKNHITLLNAFRLFLNNHPSSELWLIGEDGGTKQDAEKFVKDHNLTYNVKFLGVQSNVYPYLHEADIFTLPSNYEGVPMTLIEAMGSALPIVATAVGGVPDMLNDSNAILTENDATQIAEGFEKYYNDIKLRELHGKNALAASDKFSSKIMAEKYIQLYGCK